ncbi:MAG: hypothetical protein ABIK89_16870, partial [Planctomycetota bacterium]
FFGEVLAKELARDQHIVDLLRLDEAEVEQRGSLAHVQLFLPHEDAACLAVLPRRIAVTIEGERFNVRVSGSTEDCRVKLCDSSGKVFQSAPVEEGRAVLAVDESAGEPACVKLCRENLLLDLAAVPASR